MLHKPSKTKKRKTILFVVPIIVAVLFLTVFFVSHKILASLEGWGSGIWNNYVAGHAENDPSVPPTIGWLSSSSELSGCGGALSKKYSINLGGVDEDVDKPVFGSAWFGIGSQSDSGGACQNDPPSLGWLNFSAGYPSFCTGSDCHAAMWHKNEGGTDKEGYFDGWAKMTSLGDNGWVRLKGDNNGEKYKVTVSRTGILSGYAWNSGTESAISGNSGLGWIKMDGVKVSDCKLGCATKQVCQGQTLSGTTCDSSYCSGSGTSCVLGGDKLSWTCSNSCGDVSCNVNIVSPKVGVCGSLNGKYICDSANPPTAGKLCADAAAYNNDLNTSGITATWTCGNDCGTKVTCSASAKCGWTETNP
jgi:hypothetical protein